ncbi:glycosyltransferase family 4 protein [Aquimarina sp. ERC-38]|uniref:glycosyltransferase family 4 protein n=1 Tax=Aquimarina sp. ERC-38 TaxID=2949996 RepID=UPI0022475D0D|nr:glycosyltransferase family 4 protein [Aquimarina sp. ERC-38]UZO79266.1 glycosyltransferase family 4 protein [Aquimarina sp. ERC-38]
MRICFVSRRYFPAISGMSIYAQNLTKHLAELGHEVVMISQYREDKEGVYIYGGGPPPVENWMKTYGLRSLGEEVTGQDEPADFERDMKEMIDTALKLHQEEPFDLVHAQYMYPTGLAALEISKQLDIPNVVSIQGGDGHWVGTCCSTHKHAIDAVLQHAMSLIIGCDSFAREVSERHDIPIDRFTIISGAVDLDRFTTVAKDPDRKRNKLLYHGRVDSRKGALDLVYACDILRKRNIDFHLTISGIGPDLDASRELVEKLKMNDQVSFLGRVGYSEVNKVYQDQDIFVSPSYAEGFSNTILEAMATKLPIVATEVVGIQDCLEHNVNALLCQPGNHKALADCIEKLLKDHQLQDRLLERAYTDVMEKYSWKVVVKKVEKEYQRVLTQKVDTNWDQLYEIADEREDADLSCRFRKVPHLL